MAVVEENLIPSPLAEAGDGVELGCSSELRVQVNKRKVEDCVLVETASSDYLEPVETEPMVDMAFASDCSCFFVGRPHLGCIEEVLIFWVVQACYTVRHGRLVQPLTNVLCLDSKSAC